MVFLSNLLSFKWSSHLNATIKIIDTFIKVGHISKPKKVGWEPHFEKVPGPKRSLNTPLLVVIQKVIT